MPAFSSSLSLGSPQFSDARLAICTLRYRVGKRQLLFAARADDLADASAKIDP